MMNDKGGSFPGPSLFISRPRSRVLLHKISIYFQNPFQGFVAQKRISILQNVTLRTLYRDVHKKLTHLFYNFHGTKRYKDDFADTKR